MTQQTHGTPELKYSEETFRDMYEALKKVKEWLGQFGEHSPITFSNEMELDEILRKALAKAGGR